MIYWCPEHDALNGLIDYYVDIYNCDGCDKPLTGEDDQWYSCEQCRDYFSTFDLCSACFDTKLGGDLQHDHDRKEFVLTSLAEKNDDRKVQLENCTQVCQEIADSKKPKRPAKKRTKSTRPKGTHCNYCWTTESSNWRTGYNGLLMCEGCFNSTGDSFSGAQQQQRVQDGPTDDGNGLSPRESTTATPTLLPNAPFASNCTAPHPDTTDDPSTQSPVDALDEEEYTHNRYLTRNLMGSLTRDQTQGDGQCKVLESYGPKPGMLFSLLLYSSYFDIPGRAPRWASHSGEYHVSYYVFVALYIYYPFILTNIS